MIDKILFLDINVPQFNMGRESGKSESRKKVEKKQDSTLSIAKKDPGWNSFERLI